MKREAGFTLIELGITVAVVAIVSAIAVPIFAEVIRHNRMTTQVNLFVTAMHYARSEAVNLRQNFSVVAINGDWEDGWEVQNAAGVVQRSFPALHATMTFVSTNGVFTFTYAPNGRLVGAGDTLTMCDDRVAETGRSITVSALGRTSINTGVACL